LNQSNLIQKS